MEDRPLGEFVEVVPMEETMDTAELLWVCSSALDMSSWLFFGVDEHDIRGTTIVVEILLCLQLGVRYAAVTIS